MGGLVWFCLALFVRDFWFGTGRSCSVCSGLGTQELLCYSRSSPSLPILLLLARRSLVVGLAPINRQCSRFLRSWSCISYIEMYLILQILTI